MTEFTTTGNTCIHCGARIVSTRRWQLKHTAEERAWGLANGYARSAGAHICHNCRANGLTAPRVTYTADDVLSEWRHFADLELSIAENCRRLAPRMGLKWRSLERAIARARSNERGVAA
jgi:hypothetical protein